MQSAPTHTSPAQRIHGRQQTGLAAQPNAESAAQESNIDRRLLQVRRTTAPVQQGAALVPLGESVNRLGVVPIDVVERTQSFLAPADALNMALASRPLHFAVAESTADYQLNWQLRDQERALVRIHMQSEEGSAPERTPGRTNEIAIARRNIKMSAAGTRNLHNKAAERERTKATNEGAAKIACLQVQDLLATDSVPELEWAADILAQRGQPVAAAHALQRAIEQSPHEVSLHMHRARVCIQAGLEGGLLDEAIAEAQTMMALDDHLTLAARDLIVRVHLLRRDVAAASTELARLPLPATRAMLESLRGNANAARTLLRSINTRWVDPSEVGEAYAWTGDFESATEAWEEALRQGTLDFAASVHSPFVGPQFWSDEWGADFLYRHFRQPEQLQTLHLPLHLPVQDGSGLTQADRESLMCERVQRVQAVMSLDHPLAVRHVAELMLELGSAGEAAAWLRDHAPTMVNDMDWNLAMAHVLLHMGPEHADEALHRANASISLARVLGNRLSSRVATQLRGESNTTFKVRELAQARALRRVSYIDEGSIELRCRAMLLRGNAVDLVREVAALQDRYIWASTTLAMCLQAAGRTQEAAQAMEDAIAEGEQDNAAGIAEAFAMMGDADRFFEWVDIAMKTDYQGLLRLAIAGSPFVPDSIAQSRRWHAVLERLNRSPAQLSAVQFSTARPVMPSEVFHSHLAGGRLEDAARMIRAGEFGEASADRAVTLLIQSLDEAQLERALQLQLQGEGRPFAERIEFALSMIDEGLLGDRTSRAYVTVLRRLEDSATGNEMLPELTRPERLAQYGMTRQDIAALEIASQFH